MNPNDQEILVVEHDKALAELEKRCLTRAGWRVRAVHGVKDALALLSDQAFGAIVLDYRLPDGEPWRVLEAAHQRIPRIPVIMATAMGSEGVAAEALHRGVSDYVKKAEGFWEELPEAVGRVTQAAAIEEGLHLGHNLFQLIAGNLSDIIVAGNPREGVTYISPACTYVLGYQPQELRAALRIEMVHPDDRGRLTEALAGLGKHGSFAFRCRTKYGEYRWLEANLNLLTDPVSKKLEVIAIARDITERKNAEKEISKLNATLELLLNGAKDYAIFMLDREGRIVTWNGGAERLKGYSAAEIIGQHFSVFYSSDAIRLDHPAEVLRTAVAEGRFEEEDWRIRKDGSRFWANVVIMPIRDGQGELCGFSKVTRDASELKKAADALIASRERAEDANRAKSEFLAAMSHEIRTPMNAILGMTDLLKETELAPVQREYTDRCRRAGSTLLTLINDILDLSKIESGRFELESVPFDLEDLVETIVEMIAPRAHLKGVGLFARVDPATPSALIGDPVRLQQILINLLGNAAKFTQQGEIVLSVTPQPGKEPGRVQFEVKDSGIGIPPDKLGIIFEDFTQAESSTTRRFGGTGLGLGIARRLANCMGGELTVSSVVGEGSTFRFDALFGINQQAAQSNPSKEVHDLAGKRVLVVDDNPTNCLILSKMCAGWGMRPSEANSATEARHLVEEALREGQPFALALLDVLMPEVGGFEAMAQIRALSPDVRIIMTTSNNQPGDATKARAMGAAAFAVKPIRRTELLRLVCAAIVTNQQAGVRTEIRAEAGRLTKGLAESRTKILVVEDSEDNRFLVEAYLSRQPYQLRFALDGQEALNAFQKESFDLVLMDVQMPVMDGLTATTMIRALEGKSRRARTPILALTADALLGDAERSQAAGCDGHLAKPISKEHLITAIENFRFAVLAGG